MEGARLAAPEGDADLVLQIEVGNAEKACFHGVGIHDELVDAFVEIISHIHRSIYSPKQRLCLFGGFFQSIHIIARESHGDGGVDGFRLFKLFDGNFSVGDRPVGFFLQIGDKIGDFLKILSSSELIEVETKHHLGHILGWGRVFDGVEEFGQAFADGGCIGADLWLFFQQLRHLVDDGLRLVHVPRPMAFYVQIDHLGIGIGEELQAEPGADEAGGGQGDAYHGDDGGPVLQAAPEGFFKYARRPRAVGFGLGGPEKDIGHGRRHEECDNIGCGEGNHDDLGQATDVFAGDGV